MICILLVRRLFCELGKGSSTPQGASSDNYVSSYEDVLSLVRFSGSLGSVFCGLADSLTGCKLTLDIPC